LTAVWKRLIDHLSGSDNYYYNDARENITFLFFFAVIALRRVRTERIYRCKQGFLVASYKNGFWFFLFLHYHIILFMNVWFTALKIDCSRSNLNRIRETRMPNVKAALLPGPRLWLWLHNCFHNILLFKMQFYGILERLANITEWIRNSNVNLYITELRSTYRHYYYF